jgi:hypothetical protein
VQVVLPIEGSICQMGMDNELMEEVTGTWTLSANPPIEPNRPSLGDPGLLVGGTPFSFEIAGLVVEDVVADKKPDVENPVSGQMLSGGAVFRAQTRMLGQSPGEPDYLGQPYRLAWKATVYAEGGDNVRTLYGSGGSPGSEIAVDWDGTDDGGKRVPAEKTYGVMLEVLQNRFEGSAISPRGTVMAVTPGYGPEGVLPGGGGVTIIPNPYIPYTAEEQQHTFDEYGNPIWFDDDEDSYPDRFPDHDGDGEPDFEPGEPPPGIFIRPAIIKPGFDLSRWELKILSEDGEVLHTRVEENARNRFGSNGEYEWKSSDIPADLEPQELKVEIVPTYCRRTTVDIQVLAQGTPGTECGPGATLEGTVAYGEKEGLLEIYDGSSNELIASSEPDPYVGGSDPIASLDLASLGPVINLSASNDQVILKPRNANRTIRIRYLVPKAKAVGKTSVDMRVTSTTSNPTPFTISLPRRTEGAVNVEFMDTFTLTSSGSSGGKQIRVVPPSGPTFSLFDYTSDKVAPGADPEADYDFGNVQDGLEFLVREAGTKLGWAAMLKPSEASSKGYRKQKVPPIGNALISAGFEDLVVDRPGAGVKAWTRVKNQAQKLYISSHGGRGGGIFADDGSVGPDDVGEQWKDSLRLVIMAGCSVFNIGNFNDWQGYTSSPGVEWRAKVNADCVLLGYSATAPGANPGDGLSIDTRVLIRYRQYLPAQQARYSSPGEAQAMAWLLANAAMEHRQSDNACAITNDHYYWISFECYAPPRRRRIDDPHDVAEASLGVESESRRILRLAKSHWTKRGLASIKDLKEPGLKEMVRFPNARPGESERI